MHSLLSQVLGGRRCIGTAVSIVFTTEMFGCWYIHITTERVSGSLSG